MNRREPKGALEAAGVSRYNCRIEGFQSPATSLGEFVMEARGEGWVVYGFDRGEEVDTRHFDTEGEAARYMLAELTRPTPTRPPFTPEEERRARDLQAQTSEQMEAELRRRGFSAEEALRNFPDPAREMREARGRRQRAEQTDDSS